MKNCKKCQTEKELNQFSKNKSSNDGLQSWCKSCKSETEKDYYGTEKWKSSKNRWKYKLSPAVYEIRNTLTNKVYIGQSIEPNKRIQQHFSNLKGGYHDNPNLQADFDLHGESVFVSNILENCEPLELEKQETKYINKNRRRIYNIQKA